MKKAERIEPNDINGFQCPCLAGAVSRSDDGSSLYVWALFKRSDVDPSLIEAHNQLDETREDEFFDLGMWLTSWGPYSNGVGRWFGSEPVTIIGRNHILVRQFRALDI